jgi:hypothetical protein
MLAVALVGVTSIVLAGPTYAQPLDRGTFHDEFTEVIEDFCDVPGLTVQLDGVVDGRFLFNPHGPDGLAYYMESIRISSTFTNVDNGNTITAVERSLSKDLKVTDNGDGTLTILVLATGNATLYGQDGKTIGRNPGQVRFEILIDDGGTPDDPFDDEFLADLGLVKGSTGRSDDFCEAAVPALTS